MIIEPNQDYVNIKTGKILKGSSLRELIRIAAREDKDLKNQLEKGWIKCKDCI